MLLLFFSLCQPFPADTLKQDHWLAWITPTSLFRTYHPAVEAGLEFKPKQRTAYTLSYGIDLGSSGNESYNNQPTKYLRLGT
jgi:hypothetical protein